MVGNFLLIPYTDILTVSVMDMDKDGAAIIIAYHNKVQRSNTKIARSKVIWKSQATPYREVGAEDHANRCN